MSATPAASDADIAITVNGRVVVVPPGAWQSNLLDFLRAGGLTGAKEGCAEGECGACAVALVTPHGPGSAYRVVNSCLLPLPVLAGQEIVTVESLTADGELTPAQAAMAAAGGSQCGYCTPGFVMSLFAEQFRPGRSGACEPLAMAGNLCRCTGYRPIRDAALALGPPPMGLLLDRLSRPAPLLPEIQTSRFSRPHTVDACLAALAQHPEATIVAGGTDLGVEINLRHRRWSHLVSLDGIDELRQFAEDRNSISIGAALPLADIASRWTTAPPAFAEWLELFASPLIRHRATLGGNLVTASPIGDAAPLLLALDASVDAAGASGRRRVPLSSFFASYRKTALAPREILTTIVIPKPLPSILRFYKVAKRRVDDISTVAAAIALDVDPGGIVRTARLAFGGVAATPVRAGEAERALVGTAFGEASIARAQAALDRTLTPLSDHRGSKEYRLAVSKRLIEKCWWEVRG